jgi:hypothetical protein
MTETNFRHLTSEESLAMEPYRKVFDDMMLGQMMRPTLSNAIGSTLCNAAVQSIALAIMMSERKSGPDIELRGKQLDFMLVQLAEAYTAEIARIEALGPAFHRMIDTMLALGRASRDSHS